jgi:hypothetical protein
MRKTIAAVVGLSVAAAAASAGAMDGTDPARCPAHAQHTHPPGPPPPPYAGQEGRTVKSLSADQVEAYREGRGAGLALPAELNHHPGPRHVLDLAGELALSPDQVIRTRSIHQQMTDEAKRRGADLIAAEARVDTLFAGQVDEGQLRDAIEAAARLQGELRFVHLRAHIATRALLTQEQVVRYDRLRGYGGPAGVHPRQD